MKKAKKINYTDEPIGKIKVIPDFLPEPYQLVLKTETKKITLSLTKESLEFFKDEAEKHHTNYQSMIRELLAQYAAHYSEKTASSHSKLKRRFR